MTYGGENSHIEALNFYPIFILLDECKVPGVRCQCSALPLANKTASLIVEETDERRTSNIERPTSNNVFYLFNKKAEQAY